MDLPTALVAIIAVAIISYVVTVVHAATTRTLGGQAETYRPEERLVAWPKWLSGLIGTLLVVWLLYHVRGILLPFMLGGAIAYLLNPGITLLERKGWTRERAIGLVFGTFLALFVLAVLLIVPRVTAEARDLVDRYDVYEQRTRHLVMSAQETVVGWGRVVGMLPKDVRKAFANLGEKAQEYAANLLSSSIQLLNRSLVLVSLLIITPVVTFWVLRDYRHLGQKLLRAIPEPRRSSGVAVLSDINQLVGSYLLGMATLVVLVGIFAVIVLSVAGVPFPVLLGVMTGVLYLIPYVGFPAALAVIALTMAVTSHVAADILLVVGVLFGGNIAFDYLVTPRVIGTRVGLHPLVVIFAILAGAATFKFMGAMLAVPAAGAIKVVLVHYWPELFTPDPPSAETT